MATSSQLSDATMNRGGRPSKLQELMENDPTTYQKILMYIRAGAYDHVVAEAMGVAADTFSRWMSRGRQHEKDGKQSPYRRLHRDVVEARAQARLMVEMEVRRTNPEFWLRCGPGRTREDMPGWTDKPLQVSVTTQPSPPQPIDRRTLAEALCVLEDLGLIQRTEVGRALFEH